MHSMPNLSAFVDFVDTPRARLTALQSLLTQLLEAPDLALPITREQVEHYAHSGHDFLQKETSVVASLCNVLYPFVPHRTINNDGKEVKPLLHVATQVPLIMIANTVFRATGRAELCQELCPSVSSSAVHAIPLGSAGCFEMLCQRGPGFFDIKGADGTPMTSVAQAAKASNKTAVLASFFSLQRIQDICHKHGLDFANR